MEENWYQLFENIHKKKHKPNVNCWERILKNSFNTQYEMKANHLLPRPLKLISKYEKEIIKKQHLLEKYSKYNFLIILPYSGIQINCTKNFIDTIPLLRNIFSLKWEERPYQIQYFEEDERKLKKGPHIFVSYSDLECFHYDIIPQELVSQYNEEGGNNYYNSDNLLKSIKECLKYA